MNDDKNYQFNTRLLRVGRSHSGWVNPPITRGSSYAFENIETWRDTRTRRDSERLLSYGARGTETTFVLEDALVELEGGFRAKLFPTGLAAITMVLLAYLRHGDHVLITDSVYEPARNFCADYLERMGICYDFFCADGSDIEQRIKPETRMVYVESPGSLVYEMVDLPAIARWAHERNCLVVADNTWGAGMLYKPLELGADVSIQAATKYLCGHADVVMGAVVTTEQAWLPLEKAAVSFGQTVSSDDAWLVLRGIRSLPIRLAVHERSALAIAKWLQQQPEVKMIYHPALPEHPHHVLWLRDCRGCNGLLTIEFGIEISAAGADKFINALRLFSLAASWGGFESLVAPVNMIKARTVTDWSGKGPLVRLHIGLESPDDLIADLRSALSAINKDSDRSST